MSETLYDIAMVGAGPAELTAALYAGRNRLDAPADAQRGGKPAAADADLEPGLVEASR